MTIVMIGQKGLPARSGGIERHVENLVGGLVARGFRVVVFGRHWYVEDRQAPPGVEQLFTWGIHTKHLDAITHSFTALLAARRLSPEIVHLHGVGVGLLTPFTRLMLPKAKVIVTFHCLDRLFSKWGWWARQAFRIGEWTSLRFAHRTITISQYLSDYCLSNYGGQTTYISHPIRLSQIKNTALPEKYNLKIKKYLLFVGRLLRHKGAHLLVEAYDRAQQARPELFEGVSLAIVGNGSWTDAYTDELNKLAQTVPGVKMLGEVCSDELCGLQANALFHVFPTWEEGLSLAVLEAGISGRPVVATDIGPNREALGEYAIRVRAKDVADLERGLVEAALLSENEREAMSERAGEYIAANFDYERSIDQTAKLYNETCQMY